MTKEFLSPIEEIIEDAKNGKMCILIDDEDRENEGDLVIPAQMADAEIVNFMAKYGRGLICLPMESKRIQELDLPHMAKRNTSRFDTPFTVSIEAREGTTTGISAADRALTIATAIDENKTKDDIVTPGHIFPLEARDGGVLVRAGHTEAAVDIARMAGLNPAGVICEIMNDDGTMARLPDLVEFAKEHDLKIATIADLIAYRRKYDKLIEKHQESVINSCYGGEFKMFTYRNKIEYAEHIALVKGEIKKDEPILVRMHAVNILTDIFGDEFEGKYNVLQNSMKQIAAEGAGVVVLIREPRKDILSYMVEDKNNKDSSRSKAYLRDYGIGAQILLDLGIRKMRLLTNSKKSIVALEGYDLQIEDVVEVESN